RERRATHRRRCHRRGARAHLLGRIVVLFGGRGRPCLRARPGRRPEETDLAAVLMYRLATFYLPRSGGSLPSGGSNGPSICERRCELTGDPPLAGVLIGNFALYDAESRSEARQHPCQSGVLTKPGNGRSLGCRDSESLTPHPPKCGLVCSF